MELIKVKNQSKWNQWLNANSIYCPFLQSWQWGNILIADNLAVERLAILDNDRLIAQVQVVYYNLPLNYKYAFCPQGPVVNYQLSSSEYQEAIKVLSNYFQSQKTIFWRLEPHNTKYIIPNVCKTIDINPRVTTLVNLTKSKADLLAEMKSKTRYNIRLSQKKKLKLITQKDIDSFWQLSKITSKRDRFQLHSKTHYKNVLQSDVTYQLTVNYNQTTIATAIFVGFGDTFTYLYGASDYKYRSLMAPYLLQWEGIKLGKSLDYKYYDFFGIAPKNTEIQGKTNNYKYDAHHQYAGVTRFKLGFGGEIKEDLGTIDLVLNKSQYFFYKVLRKINRMIR